jgi:hypothetical protein
MTSGLGKSALLVTFAVIGFSGCKNAPYCEALGACGGDLLKGAPNNASGLPSREWAINNIGNPRTDICEDQLELPATPLALVRQPPVPANVRPPDNVTADWCSNIVFKPDGSLAQFLVWSPPVPVKVGRLDMSADPDSNYRGSYAMQFTFEQPFSISISETCLTSQGIRVACPVVGRQIGAFLAPEANIYDFRCYDPADGEGGCQCDYDLTFIGGPNGRWYSGQGNTTINFFDDSYAPPATADYCLNGNGSLDLTGHAGTDLFNEKTLRTMHLSPPACTDGIKDGDETGVDCGGSCNACAQCANGLTGVDCTCTDGVKDGDETGIDCGGSCLGVLCDPSPSDPNNIKAACADGKQEKWEEGVDCGGPCKSLCN